jgi:DnaJ homolog subfamily C member 28
VIFNSKHPEFFLNRILQRQGAAPPWVQAQIDLTSAFTQFRDSLRADWLRHVTRQMTTASGSLNAHIHAAETYVQREISSNYTLREFKTDWETREAKFHALAVDDLNAKTRSYNTIAPYTARKGYTTLEHELRACYRDVVPQIVDGIRNRGSGPKPGPVKVFNRGAAGILEDLTRARRQEFHVNREGEFGLMDFVRSFLKKNTQ